MLKALEQNGDQYFLYMTSRGWNLPHDYNFWRITHKREPIEAEILRKEMIELKNQLPQWKVAKEKQKTYFVESICALPFDRSL